MNDTEGITRIEGKLCGTEPCPIIKNYQGWTLREVYFDEDGIPLAHRECERPPLTDQRIIELAERVGWNLQKEDFPANLLRIQVIDLVRIVEAAHGIKE